MCIEDYWNKWSDADKFSGVFSISNDQGVIFEKCQGFRNKSENLTNNIDTAFGIASGTKLFTGLSICKLIDEKKLSLGDKLWDILPYDLGQIDKRVTIFHLLTHTSGVGDYLDEEAEDSDEQFQALNEKYPVYLYEKLEYYLQMITSLPPKFEPGTRYGYSNAGFILLGLVVEGISKMSYQDFVYNYIILPSELEHTGFYRTDALPTNTAHGYIYEDKNDEWRTNIFSLPIIGGSDGGIYTCAKDIRKLWQAIFSNVIFSAEMLNEFLKQQSVINETRSYGLGVYRGVIDDKLFYYAVGGDAGVCFFTAFLPTKKIVITMFDNTEVDIYPLMDDVVKMLQDLHCLC